MLTINFYSMDNTGPFELRAKQLNHDILIKALLCNGISASNALGVNYSEKNMKGEVIDRISRSVVAKFYVTDQD